MKRKRITKNLFTVNYCCGGALVAITEGMVLGDEVQEIGRLLLQGWVHLFAGCCLADIADASFE